MPWLHTWERELQAVQAGEALPERGSERLQHHVVMTISPYDDGRIDAVAILEEQIRNLGEYHEEDQGVGHQYWQEVRRNWVDRGLHGKRFQQLVGRAVRNVRAEESSENMEHYRTLREWGFYV